MTESIVCPTCGVFVVEPYIKCAECHDPPRVFCLPCFAKGSGYENHKNNHSYIVARNNFVLFDVSWTASEELKLLDAISECGIGNWADIAKIVGSKSATECESHYFKCYIYNPDPVLPVVPEPEVSSNISPTPIPCTVSQDPPRPIVGSTMYYEMAGYMPARGDFVTEHDDYAELEIKDIDFVEEKDSLFIGLQKAVLDIYHSRLRERARRKCIIKTYGLINAKKNMECWRRYNIFGKNIIDTLKAVMRLLEPQEFDKFLAGIFLEENLKQKVKLLQECRDSGLTKLHSINTYLRLKRKQEEHYRHKTALDEVLTYVKDETSCHHFIRRQVLKENSQGLQSITGGSGRRSAPPLSIKGLPEYEKLAEKEQNLCASLRLLPTSYLQYKETLINEYRKMGYLKLANARVAIKIDVNKTRKIYDLLLEEGLVSKGS